MPMRVVEAPPRVRLGLYLDEAERRFVLGPLDERSRDWLAPQVEQLAKDLAEGSPLAGATVQLVEPEGAPAQPGVVTPSLLRAWLLRELRRRFPETQFEMVWEGA